MPLTAVSVIQDLAIVMIVALAMALISYKLKQPLMIGYILAGMIIGPYTPPFGLLEHPEVLNLFAEIGIVFLLFAVGLEYPLARLRSVGRSALLIAVVESLGTLAAGFLIGKGFGFSNFDSLFLGLAVSVTSTVILSKVLEERGVLQDDVAGLILGITIIEDVVVVSALGVLQSLASTGHIALPAVLLALGIIVLFVGASLLVGTRVIPWFVDKVAETGRADLLLIAVLGVAFGLSIVSDLIGISVATGGFIAGVMVAEARSQSAARTLVAPLKELFGAIFFVSMGALMDIGLLPYYFVPLIVLLAVAFFAKLILTYATARTQQIPRPAALRTALCLAGPGGEVSLTVVKGGADVGVVSPFVLPIVGAMTIVTALLSPYRVRLAWLGGRFPLRSPESAPRPPMSESGPF